MNVFFATSNKKKVAGAARALEKFGLGVDQIDIDLIESRAEDSADIALEKAHQAFRDLQKPVIVEDSGFYINALGGFPKTHIKFSLKTLGVRRILKMMEGEADRSAEWRMSLAFVWGSRPNDYKPFTFAEKGVLATEIRPLVREGMSDYHQVYIPKMLDPNNTLASSEIVGDQLVAWREFTAANNHYQMFGKWFAEHEHQF